MFDYTITERFMRVSWSYYIYPTGAIKPVYGILSFPLLLRILIKFYF